MNKIYNNIVFRTDSYKVSHWLQDPPKTQKKWFYASARFDDVIAFGMQSILKDAMDITTMDEVEAADIFWTAHGEPFNVEGWRELVKLGYFPLEIRAAEEGTVVKKGDAIFSVVNTDERFPWLPGWFETRLLKVWYMTTVATKQFKSKQVIKKYLELTGGDTSIMNLGFKLHSFGYRGVSSEESAEIGGMAELVTSMGTDTAISILRAQQDYNTLSMLGFSVPAAEHSTVTIWGKEREVEAYRNMLKKFAKPGALVAVVSDSWSLEKAVDTLWGTTLRQEVVESQAVVIIRPDGGVPKDIVVRTLNQLAKRFGYFLNEKGFKMLPDCVRVLQGDGIGDWRDIEEILQFMMDNNWAADNVAFGQGGGSLQMVNRDDFGFSMKCSAGKIDGVWRDVFKEPEDAPWKKSRGGKVGEENPIVWLNGKFLVEFVFEDIRDRVMKML